MTEIEIRHFHLFCGLGGAARGFNRGQARVGSMVARFRCLGGVDNDAAAVRDFERLAGVPATRLDMFDRAQFLAFHGREPGPCWREACPEDLRRASGGERPHIGFLSAPCKGFSGLLSEQQSRSAKYQALNGLTLRGVWLFLEAWKNDPVELIIFENVPRIATRGRHLLDQIVALLRSYGYVVAETTHDCGEIGGLAQSRKRFLLVARHAAKVPPFLREPEKRPLRGVGEVLERLPVPGPEPVLPMHRMPALQWRTWVRLAFVEAGSDWRSLNKLVIEDGALRDYAIAPETRWHGGVLGVKSWDEPSATVTSRGSPTTGAYAVADPRVDGHHKSVQLGVRPWEKPAGVVTGQMLAGGGPHSVADPRLSGARFNNTYRIVPWAETSPAVAGPGGPAGGLAVADPRASSGFGGKGKYRVTGFDEPAGSVIGGSTTGQGAFAVADPRSGDLASKDRANYGVTDWEEPAGTITSQRSPGQGKFSVADPRFANWHPGASSTKMRVTDWDAPGGTVTGAQQVGSGALSVADPRPSCLNREDRQGYRTQGHYGVVPWDEPTGAVPAFAKNNNGRWSVADPREAEGEALPELGDQLVAVIRSLDGTWHRPFTTLELASLQGLVDPEDVVELDGLSDSAWRERIGNAVPSDAAQAIAGVMGRTLLLAWSGETFQLASEPIWVRGIAVGLSVHQKEGPRWTGP